MWSGPIYALRKKAQLNLAGKIRITYTVSGESFVEIIPSQRAFSQLHMIYAAYIRLICGIFYGQLKLLC